MTGLPVLEREDEWKPTDMVNSLLPSHCMPEILYTPFPSTFHEDYCIRNL